MAEYVIQSETLDGLGEAMREISGKTELLNLNSLRQEILNCYYNTNVFHCYVGMMKPNDSVGKDGDIFLLV